MFNGRSLWETFRGQRLNFVPLKDEFFPFASSGSRSAFPPFPQRAEVICYENLDQKQRGGKSRTTLLQAISRENCLANIIMQTNPEKKMSGRQPGERDLNM